MQREQYLNDYELNILDYVKSAKRKGTVGMSPDNLFQCATIPYSAPTGTNARWVIRQDFNEIVNRNDTIRRFCRI